MKIKTSVLIVGAGPTGLMAACQLKRFGIDFIIIEKNQITTRLSKAMAVQARTLEIYEQMNLAHIATQQGFPTTQVNFIINNRKAATINLNPKKPAYSPYPYMLMLEQSKNEKILHEYLLNNGTDVRWKHELVELVEHTTNIIARVKNEQEEFIIEAQYCIAADGGKSVVRHQLQMPFKGGTYEHEFFVADVAMQWNVGYGELFLVRSIKTFSGFFPIDDKGHFRIVGLVPDQFADKPDLTFDDIKDTVMRDLNVQISFTQVNWFATYRVHHRVVESFRKGCVFLAGDTAHLHSPAGGQGMNTGLQDAYNLCWKLAYVIKGICSEELLDTYNEERLPIAKQLVKTTDRAFGFMVSENIILRNFTTYVFPFVAKFFTSFKDIREFIVRTVSQTKLDYIKSSASKGRTEFIKAGIRVPYFKFIEDGKLVNIYDRLKITLITLLVFDDSFTPFSLPASAQTVIIPYTAENKKLLKQRGFPNSFFYIIRPDNYIGYINTTLNNEELSNYLHDNLHIINPVKTI